MNAPNAKIICMLPMYSGNKPTPIAQILKIARQEEKRRQPPLFKIKYTEAKKSKPKRIMLRLNMIADGSTTGTVPPRSLNVFLAMSYPGN